MGEKNRRESIFEEEEIASTREGGAKGQGADDLRENEFEELNATIDAIVWFPELRTENQYTQEAVPFTGAHN